MGEGVRTSSGSAILKDGGLELSDRLEETHARGGGGGGG